MMRNEKGYTLLYALMGLMVLCVVSLLLLQLLTFFHHVSQEPHNQSEAFYLAAHQLEQELLGGQHVQVTPTSLSFEVNSDQIYYAATGGRLVRQVDSKGYEIVINDISSATFTMNDGVVVMTLVDQKGRAEQWHFICGLDRPIMTASSSP
ncbi:ComGF family competence protein [Pullulanibacillus sp. KACC 23026]|uniref:ComGF family competence protein n=1 Tax=Pullulanibacillus sp. KACC 23026 TaxID=3028315 RepID=UPI0023AE7C6A|nr:ComGF family competence protein [Pullulanibacillus sp. KACC 23026]WEG14286.1 ComGF family competence protein [Pullulanibacillus sp. KACC 23026]